MFDDEDDKPTGPPNDLWFLEDYVVLQAIDDIFRSHRFYPNETQIANIAAAFERTRSETPQANIVIEDDVYRPCIVCERALFHDYDYLCCIGCRHLAIVRTCVQPMNPADEVVPESESETGLSEDDEIWFHKA